MTFLTAAAFGGVLTVLVLPLWVAPGLNLEEEELLLLLDHGIGIENLLYLL